MRTYHLYILSNVSRMLYVGVTGDLHRRLFEHKNKLVPGYSRNYNLHKLVYIEAYGNINDAISRINTSLEEIIQFIIDHQKDVS